MSAYWRKNAHDATRKNDTVVRKHWENYHVVSIYLGSAVTCSSSEGLPMSFCSQLVSLLSSQPLKLQFLPVNILLNKQMSEEGEKREKREGLPSTKNKLPKSHPWTWLKLHSGDLGHESSSHGHQEPLNFLALELQVSNHGEGHEKVPSLFGVLGGKCGTEQVRTKVPTYLWTFGLTDSHLPWCFHMSQSLIIANHQRQPKTVWLSWHQH